MQTQLVAIEVLVKHDLDESGLYDAVQDALTGVDVKTSAGTIEFVSVETFALGA